MSVWEYKVITSGKGGFATPALLETFLNQLGQDEWEILHFHPQPENPLAFTGLARRSTQREWTLENAVAAATRAEADKLRAEFEAKFKGAAGGGSSAPEEAAEAAPAEKAEDNYRKPRDTESDQDPDSPEEEGDEWDKLAKEDELPTFFEAIQPLMRRNQRGTGLSAGVDHLAKRWGLSEAEVVAALKECGFAIPQDEDDPPAYLEYDGDLFWVNVNRRGELWINTKEKPRPVFRVVSGRPASEPAASSEAAPASGESPAAAPAEGERREVATEHPASSAARAEDNRNREREQNRNRDRDRDRGQDQGRGQQQGLPAGPDLLVRLRPQMRRNRGGQGRSGSTGFLARALRCRENDLIAAFAALGLVPAEGGAEPARVELVGASWWLNRDQRGGIWINEDEAGSGRPAESAAAPSAATAPVDGDAGLADEGSPNVAAVDAAPSASSEPNPAVLTAVRLLLKPTKTGAVAAETGRLAETLNKPVEEFIATLERAGLKVPDKPREKPVFVEHAGEIFWLNKNARGQLWLNAKASKFAAEGDAPAAAGDKAAAKPARLQRGRRGGGTPSASEPPR